MDSYSPNLNAFFISFYQRIRETVSGQSPNDASLSPLPTVAQLARAYDSLPRSLEPPSSTQRDLPSYGPAKTLEHLLTDIAPASTLQNRSSRYWGFVTGSALPVAEAADNLVSALDQSVAVHLPAETVATSVEDVALGMLIRLLGLDGTYESDEESSKERIEWKGRTFTTGATASNILGLACGREGVIRAQLPQEAGGSTTSVAELGLLNACLLTGIRSIRVLTSGGHSSLTKAASIVGLGRSAVKEFPLSHVKPWRLDLEAVERELRAGLDGEGDRVANIVVVSAGEVNTGRFATSGWEDMRRLREICDRWGAWIHVDGAFGSFHRALSPLDSSFNHLRSSAAGIELADSITLDCHKLLNVPYDAGVFLTRESDILTSVCRNVNAAYLKSPPVSAATSEIFGDRAGREGWDSNTIQSPINVGLENSRRFRALPAYAVLMCEGSKGIAAMVGRMVKTARGIVGAIRSFGEAYELLPRNTPPSKETGWSESQANAVFDQETGICVLFRARNETLNKTLTDRINKIRRCYVSGTMWEERKATRVAVANWMVDEVADVAIFEGVLEDVLKSFEEE